MIIFLPLILIFMFTVTQPVTPKERRTEEPVEPDLGKTFVGYYHSNADFGADLISFPNSNNYV